MTDPLLEKLGKEIKKLRKEAGYSQESFAREVKLHRTYIGAIERGEKNVTVKSLSKLTDCLGIGLSDLFEEIEIK